MAGRSLKADPDLKANIDQLVAEILGETKKGYWNERTSLGPKIHLASNPAVKYPLIPISYGNSMSGILDIEAARQATQDLFAQYGIAMEKAVPLSGDGYSEEFKIGYVFLSRSKGEQTLDHSELSALDKAVQVGGLNLFVADLNRFPNMDGDLYTPTEYYLASVVDYLNWVHSGEAMSLNKVLGELPGANTQRNWRNNRPSLPGGDFETAEDMSHWSVTRGSAQRTTYWSSFGESALAVDLEPEGKIHYRLPDGESIVLSQNSHWASLAVYLDSDLEEDVTVTVSFLDGENKAWSFGEKIKPKQVKTIQTRVQNGARPIERLHALTISTNSCKPVRLYIDDIGILR